MFHKYFKFFLSLSVFLIYITTNAQTYKHQQYEIFAVNILSNGFIGGVGGVINKSEDEKILPVFLRNFGKGCLGGLIKYTSKSYSNYLNYPDNTFYAPINRMHFFLGHSIVMNASMNKKMLETYYFNYLGINFQFFPKKEVNKFQARISAASLLSFASFAIRGHDFDFFKSLEYGLFYFNLKEGYKQNGFYPYGLAYHNSIAIKEYQKAPYYFIIPHELVHTYQFYDFYPLGNYYKEKANKYLNNYSIYNFLSKYISLDHEAIYHSILYEIQPEPIYYRNYFEYEAEHFSSRKYIKRHQ